MAGNKSEVLRRYHAAARSELGLFFVPLLLAPLTLWALSRFGPSLHNDQPIPWFWYPVALVPFLIIMLWARVKGALTTKYLVTIDTVENSVGFISRTTSLVRIVDIRSMVVRQSFLDRMLVIGDIAFSSAAGTQEEVIFRRVSNPEEIKRFVKKIQDMRANDGVIDANERAELEGRRPAAPAAPAPAPRAAAPRPAPAPAPQGSDADRDELYRLLAEQEAEAEKRGR